MKRAGLIVLAATVVAALHAQTDGPLTFNPSNYTEQQLTMPDGHTVHYIAYEGIPYVTNPEAPAYQTLNFYVPKGKERDQRIPILLRNYSGGYLGAAARQPSPFDATGRALREGIAVCIAGVRGSNTVADGRYVGTAPAPLLDLKAAVRYLHYNDAAMPGNAERIVSDGIGSGAALSALLGTTGDNAAYVYVLRAMGAAAASDAIHAAVCFAPITDLGHADMEYEWLYGFTDNDVRHLDPSQTVVSQALAARCPDYINSLELTTPDGTSLNSANYRDYLRQLLINSAQQALQAGCPIPDSIGVTIYMQRNVIPGYPEYVTPAQPPLMPPLAPPVGPPPLAGPGVPPPPGTGPGTPPPPVPPSQPVLVYTPPTVVYTDYVAALDLDRYLSYVATVTPLKTPPAFDKLGVLGQEATVENKLFATSDGLPLNFTDYSLQLHTGNPAATLSPEMQQRVEMMNPMAFIGRPGSLTAPYWYIRQGALDRDTSFLTSINLALKLSNNGANVDFTIPWNRAHQGDYDLDALMKWIKHVTK